MTFRLARYRQLPTCAIPPIFIRRSAVSFEIILNFPGRTGAVAGVSHFGESLVKDNGRHVSYTKHINLINNELIL